MVYGIISLLTNRRNMDKIKVLDYYRKKDSVEKVFDIVKKEMDGDLITPQNFRSVS